MAKLKDTQVDGNLSFTGELLNKDGVNLETAFSNPNLLINSDFRNPINQRGQTTYTRGSSDCYTIDRWMINYNTVINVLDGCIEYVGNAANNNRFYYRFETPLTGTYTISVYVKEVTAPTGLQTLDDSSYITRMALHQGLNTVTVDVSNMTAIHFTMFKTGATAKIEWIKLEQGSIATPFIPRLYGEELALCQRYFERKLVLGSIVTGLPSTTGYILNAFDLAPKRVNPTITLYDLSSNEGYINRSATTKSKGRVYIYPKSYKDCGYELISDDGVSATYISGFVFADAEIY